MRRAAAAAIALVAAGLAGCGSASTATTTAAAAPAPSTTGVRTATSTASPTSTTTTTTAATSSVASRRPGPPYPITTRTLTFTDARRTVVIPGEGRVARRLVTVIRYPADASRGPFPLVVFGHGFAVTPATYWRLLRAWARAGYVVAAPVFPLENEHAPGGPNESDLVNQPGDMSFLITRLTASGGPLHGIVDPRRVAVSGQSDGGETALAVAYDRAFRDPRVRAAVILSGAQIPGIDQLEFPRGGPPLLATQGTADTINPPGLTDAFFALAHRPKFLLRLEGAAHLPPYTGEQPQLGIVERVSVAFLDRYLTGRRAGVRAMAAAGDRPGVSELVAEP